MDQIRVFLFRPWISFVAVMEVFPPHTDSNSIYGRVLSRSKNLFHTFSPSQPRKSV